MSATTTETPSVNGTEQATFPLDSYRAAARHFRRPFTPAAIKFKVQATWPKEQPANALIVSYMDARLVVDRLNLLLPDLWWDEYDQVDSTHMVCKLTVDGVTRRDIGEGSGKALYSDALKRAAVKFGIGVSLYAVPKMILKGSDVKAVTAGGKKSLAMTSDGERTVRGIYESWLSDHGTKAFGEPLDHGDIEGAQGDYEAEAAAEHAEAEAPLAGTGVKKITKTRAEGLVKAAVRAGVLDRLQLAAAHVYGDDVGDCSTEDAAATGLVKLNTDQANRLREWIDKKAKEALDA